MFLSKNRKVVKILHYERDFYVLYEKRPVMGKFKKPVFDEISKCYRIQWSDMAYLTESTVVDKMYEEEDSKVFQSDAGHTAEGFGEMPYHQIEMQWT